MNGKHTEFGKRFTHVRLIDFKYRYPINSMGQRKALQQITLKQWSKCMEDINLNLTQN